MIWIFERLLPALAAILSCFLLAREAYRLRRARTLGPLLWHAPGHRPVAAYFWFVLGGLRISDFLYAWHKSGLVEYKSASLGALFLLVAWNTFLTSRGLAVHEAGVDAGSMICRWNELRKWRWVDNRQAIRFWSTSPLFPGPHEVRQEFDPELDALFNARVPAEPIAAART